MPIYVPAGSILPVGQLIQNTTRPQTDLTIFVYAGKNGTFTLYEDENVNYNYEKGLYSSIQFSYNNNDKTISISDRKGNFTGMVKERNFHFILVDHKNPAGIDTRLQELKTIHYVGVKTSQVLE
jgi:alpha-D-xyloside xylohydrolase